MHIKPQTSNNLFCSGYHCILREENRRSKRKNYGNSNVDYLQELSNLFPEVKLLKYDLNIENYLQELGNLFPEVKQFLSNLKIYLFSWYNKGFPILSFYTNKTQQVRTNYLRKRAWFPLHLHLWTIFDDPGSCHCLQTGFGLSGH